MIKLKTAVLFAASLKIGAILGGSSQQDAELLYDFGRSLGMAFQLQDDLLDTYGDPLLMGKNRGTDIVDNKKTYMVIKALETASSRQKDELTGWLSAGDFDREEKIASVTALFDALGVKKIAEKKIRDFYRGALSSLEKLQRPAERKAELNNFASFLMNRNK